MCKYRYRSRYTRTTHYTNQRVTDKQENNCYIYCNIHCFRSVQNICSIAMSTFSWIIQISIGRQDRGGCLHDNHRTKVQKSIILFLLLLSHKWLLLSHFLNWKPVCCGARYTCYLSEHGYFSFNPRDYYGKSFTSISSAFFPMLTKLTSSFFLLSPFPKQQIISIKSQNLGMEWGREGLILF